MPNWDKLRNNITKEKPVSFYHITEKEYLEKWTRCIEFEWINNRSEITEHGFSVYVTTVSALGKDSILGGPATKSKTGIIPVNLKKYQILKYDKYKKEFTFDSNGTGYMEVLIRCINGNGEPRVI